MKTSDQKRRVNAAHGGINRGKEIRRGEEEQDAWSSTLHREIRTPAQAKGKALHLGIDPQIR